ncbi:hypothetical protein ACSBOB_14785 [Mesorhizobium sp. ASY16-5R]|uniref:hypothetical protein n=1 Tax=Mesorhizobium sp. ASY16-5R TaxID=3445772 RepID=UPI003FA141D7
MRSFSMILLGMSLAITSIAPAQDAKFSGLTDQQLADAIAATADGPDKWAMMHEANSRKRQHDDEELKLRTKAAESAFNFMEGLTSAIDGFGRATQQRDAEARAEEDFRRVQERAIAEAPRRDQLVADVRECIATNARSLSRGQDAAYFIANAAIDLCHDQILQAVQSIAIAEMRPHLVDRYYNQAIANVRESAITVVIQTRAGQ